MEKRGKGEVRVRKECAINVPPNRSNSEKLGLLHFLFIAKHILTLTFTFTFLSFLAFSPFNYQKNTLLLYLFLFVSFDFFLFIHLIKLPITCFLDQMGQTKRDREVFIIYVCLEQWWREKEGQE